MQEDPDGGWKNEQITTALWDELIAELHGLCRVAAEVNILFYGLAIIINERFKRTHGAAARE